LKANHNSETEDYEWFNERKGGKGHFDVTDIQGTTIRCDDEYIKHVIKQHRKENRHEFINNTEDIIKEPDEIWNNKNAKGELVINYVKYYDDFPYTVNVKNGKAFSMYKYVTKKGEVNTDSIGNDRTGFLLYRKN
jgi:hypothetical protein